MKQLVIKYFLLSATLSCLCYSQGTDTKDISNKTVVNKTFLGKTPGNSLIKETDSKITEKEITLYRYSLNSSTPQNTSKEELNVVSSFRSNIRFGGFWDKYAILNFTPDMQLKPFEFISIYAHHNISYLIPIKDVKEHFKSLALQSAAVLLVDNSVKLILPSNNLISSIVNFAMKNIVILFMNKTIVNHGSERVIGYGSYHYSVSIRF